MTYASEVLADAPWGFWRLTESSFASVANDSGSNGAAFTLGSGVTLGRTGLIADGGTAASGSGSAHIATLGSIPASLAGASVTFEAWVTIPAGNLKGAFFDVGTVPSNGWAVGIGGSTMENVGRQLIILHEAVAWKPTGYNFTTGTHHLVVTRSSANLFTIYVDGTSVYTSTFAPNAPTGSLWVGGASNGSTRALSSTIVVDNVAMYASALSPARVTAHYNSGAGDNTAVTADAPVVWLKLDELGAASFGDTSGNGRSLMPSGTLPTLAVPGPMSGGSAVDYSTAAGYASTVATQVQPTTVTYEVWVNLPSAPVSQSTVLAVGGGGIYGATSAVMITADGKVRFSLYKGSDASIVSPTALTYGEWHHVVCSIGAGGAKIRINGTTVASSAATSVDTFTTSPVYLRNGGPNTSSGAGAMKIAEPAVWMAQLSDARTDAHYSAALASGPTSLAALLGGQASLTAAASVTARLAAALAADTTLTADLALVGKVQLAVALAAESTLAAALTVTGNASLAATFTAQAALAASLTAISITDTSTRYANDGYGYDGMADVYNEPPIDEAPAYAPGRKKVMHVHQSMPAPTLVDGRPV